MFSAIEAIEEAFIWHLYQFTHMGSNLIFDSLFLIITKLGDLGFIWIIFSTILLLTKKYRLLGALVLLTLVVTTVEVELLKHLVGRPRPFVVLPIEPVLVSVKPMTSFPSGHTAASFAAAVMLGYGLPKYKNYFIGLAILIAISRLYLAVHFPTDVLVGAIIGSVTSILILYFYMKVKGSKPKFQYRNTICSVFIIVLTAYVVCSIIYLYKLIIV